MNAQLNPKPPPNIPAIGDRCKLRGRPASGVLRRVNELNCWAQVEWDDDARGPAVVHLWELDRKSEER